MSELTKDEIIKKLENEIDYFEEVIISQNTKLKSVLEGIKSIRHDIKYPREVGEHEV